jgi:hypothetical protein
VAGRSKVVGRGDFAVFEVDRAEVEGVIRDWLSEQSEERSMRDRAVYGGLCNATLALNVVIVRAVRLAPNSIRAALTCMV